MAKFSVGDRVRIPNRHPEAYKLLWEQIGTVILADIPLKLAGEDVAGQTDERQYVVRFDGSQGNETVYESWLEPAPSGE